MTIANDQAPKILDLPIGLDATGMRKEFDSLGTVEVPADHYWGAQTQRSLEHFNTSSRPRGSFGQEEPLASWFALGAKLGQAPEIHVEAR